MRNIKKAIHAANQYVVYVALALIMIMMFATVADVLARMLFKPIPGIFELTRYSLAIIVFTSLGFSQINKVHIAIDLLVKRFPGFVQTIIDSFIYLVAAVIFVIVFWQMLVYAGRMIDTNLITSVLRLPVYPFVTVASIGVLCFALVLFTDLGDAIVKLIKRRMDK